MKFQEVKPPPQMMLQMAAAGSRSIRVWARDSGSAMVTAIQSEDPSRDDGGYEWHLSVSASDSHGPRYPNRKEVGAAMDAAGWLKGSFTTSHGNHHTVHVYRKEATVKDSLTVQKDQYSNCNSFEDCCDAFLTSDPQMQKFFGASATLSERNSKP